MNSCRGPQEVDEAISHFYGLPVIKIRVIKVRVSDVGEVEIEIVTGRCTRDAL